MSSYLPRSLLDQARPETSDPTYRMSMLPFGTYPNTDGSGEHFGLAVPGMVQEPMNALMRLIGTPSQPGTFTQGPGYGSNSEDMRTLLETFLGGNATRGMGAVERGAMEAPAPRPQTPSAALFPDVLETKGIKRTQAGGGETWASESPFGFVYGRLDPNEGAVRIKSSQVDEAARGQGHGIDLYRRLIDAAHAEGLPVISDRNISSAAQNIYPALERRGYQVEYNPNPNGHQGGHFIRPQGYDGPAFFSDQLPSLWGSALQGQNDQPYPNSLFGY